MVALFDGPKIEPWEITAALRNKTGAPMHFRFLVMVALVMFLAGCNESALMKKFIPPEVESADKEYVEQLRQGNFEQIVHDLDPSLSDPNIRDTFSKMRALFPAGAPKSIKLVGAHTTHFQASSRVDLTFEYEFSEKWLIVNIVTQKEGEVSTISGFHISTIPDSVENLNKFTLRRKSALQYFTLLCAVGSLLFTLYVFALCVRSTDMKPKWLWLIVVLVGVGRLAVNWGTDEYTYQLIAINIPCFQMTRPLYGPWTVAAFVPVGAIVFLHLQWKKKITGRPVRPADLPPRSASTGV